MYVGGLGGLHHLLVRDLSEVGSVADVLGNGGIEEDGLLGDNPHLGPQPAEVEVTKISSVESQFPRGRVVESLQEGDNGALPAPTGANQGQGLAGGDGDSEPIENGDVWSGGILEGDVFGRHGSGGVVL